MGWISKGRVLAAASRLTLASVLLALSAASVEAQTPLAPADVQTPRPTAPAGPAAPADTSGQIQEVIVTAQRRAEPLQKVPVAVQVVSGQTLQSQNFNSAEDLAQIIPDVHLVNTGNLANSLNIRGIGSGSQNPAFDQSVATFVDDIYLGRSRLIQSNFLDEDRLEVLKGPQTTFFGNNAIAGALNVVTKKPDDRFDGYARVLGGSYGTYAAEGAASLPVNDQLSFRVAGIANGQTGWIRNVDTGKDAPGEQNQQGRVTALYRPSQDFDATLKLEGGYNKILGASSNTPQQVVHCPPPAGFKQTTLYAFCPYALAAGTPLGLDNDKNAGLAGQYARLTTVDSVLTLNYHKDGYTFSSITGYYAYHFTLDSDNAAIGTTPISTNQVSPEDYHQTSEELRVTSPTGRRIEYLAGVYYQDDEINNLFNGSAPYVSSSLPTYAKLGLFSPTVLGQLEQALPIGYDVGFTQKEAVESGFASLTWHATDKLKFDGGLRAISDHKKFVGTVAYGQDTQTYGGFIPYPTALQKSLGFFLGPAGTYPYARTDQALMESADAEYQVDPTSMLYAKFSHGFKAGGFNGTSPSLVGGTAEPTFGPEYVDAYEVGLKSEFLNHRLLFNLDLFNEHYSGLQVNTLVQLQVNSTIAVANAASSLSQGAELETQWVVTPDFRLSANATYLDAHYLSFPKASTTLLQKQQGITSQDLSGRPLDFAPTWSGAFSAEYRFHLPRGFLLSADVSPFFQTSYFNSNGTDDPNFLIKGHVRLDGKLTLDSPGRRWALDLIGKNLTDANIPVFFGTNNLPGGKEEPINIAGQLRYRW